MKKFISPAACEDILRQYRYLLLDQDRPLVAERFRRTIEAEIKKLCRTPRVGVPVYLDNPRLAGLRSWLVEGFPAIRIYYLSSKDEVQIVRVLHGKRDLGSILEQIDPL